MCKKTNNEELSSGDELIAQLLDEEVVAQSSNEEENTKKIYDDKKSTNTLVEQDKMPNILTTSNIEKIEKIVVNENKKIEWENWKIIYWR